MNAPGERRRPAPAARRLASWLRARTHPEPPAEPRAPADSPTAPEGTPSTPPPSPPPSSGLRPQPDDDASVYPLF
ncbi:MULTISPECIES: hypothetical protein [unclassified Streptomyces]|uniref:hypothetical protein n=1 Tax=unclassified Streptomyces TaxID=2593676 RepID=UPI003806B66C